MIRRIEIVRFCYGTRPQQNVRNKKACHTACS
jgi:hypothetical protein